MLDLRVSPIPSWDQDDIRARLKQTLPDYPNIKSQRRWQAQMTMQDDRLPTTITQDHGLLGVIMRSNDEKQVAQFQHDGFSFSRLQPYESWQPFYDEAMRLWHVYAEMTHPLAVNRLGLRFINQIDVQLQGSRGYKDILSVPPTPPAGVNLPYANFFVQETFAIPSTSFVVNLIRTVDSSIETNVDKASVIIDVDVFTTSVSDDEPTMNEQIGDMRWIKNKIFFSSITEQAKESMR